MVASSSRLSYLDCIQLMDQALGNTKGVKIPFDERGNALHYRTRAHTARTIDRNDNRLAYNAGHPLHGRSIYDVLVIREPREEDGRWWLYIEKMYLNIDDVIPLGEPEQEKLDQAPQMRIEGPVEPEPEPEPDAKITIFDPPPKVSRRV